MAVFQDLLDVALLARIVFAVVGERPWLEVLLRALERKYLVNSTTTVVGSIVVASRGS